MTSTCCSVTKFVNLQKGNQMSYCPPICIFCKWRCLSQCCSLFTAFLACSLCATDCISSTCLQLSAYSVMMHTLYKILHLIACCSLYNKIYFDSSCMSSLNNLNMLLLFLQFFSRVFPVLKFIFWLCESMLFLHAFMEKLKLFHVYLHLFSP